MQRSTPKKPKSCVLKNNSIKSEKVELGEKVTLKPPFDFNFVMPPPSDKKLSTDNDNVETPNESQIGDGVEIEPKIAPNHYLSPKEKSEKNDQEQMTSESSKMHNEEIKINTDHLKINNSEMPSIIHYSPTSENEEQNQLKKVNEVISSLDDKSDESKISGTDFDLNKIRSEMKGLMPTSTNSNNDLIQNTETFILDQKDEIEVPKSSEPVTDDVYEFKESESCSFNTNVIEEKLGKAIRHDTPKLFNFEKPNELPLVIGSAAQVSIPEVVEENRSMIPFVPNSNSIYLFDNNVEIKVYENMNIRNEIEDPISHSQSDNESNESQQLISSDIVTVNTLNIKEIEESSQDQTCHEETVSDIKDEVLDLCMKPPKSPPNNIFSMPESNEVNEIIVEDDDDDEDDDESKLVIAENYKMDVDFVVLGKEYNSSNGQIENIQTQSLPPQPPSIHPQLESEIKSSYQMNREMSVPEDTDDESTVSCNENVQNALIQSFQMYSRSENHLTQSQIFIEANDDSTNSDFEFNLKKMDNTQNIVCRYKMKSFTNESVITDKLDKYDYDVEKDKYENEKTLVLPELQCREEIIDEDTVNNALVIDYNHQVTAYDIHKPSTSRDYFDSTHQARSTFKDEFYETDTNSDTKKSFIEATQGVKSVIFDTNTPVIRSLFDHNIPSCTNNDLYDHNIPTTSKSSFYENSLPSTSKSFYNPEADVNNVLFCEETIPGSPTGMLEEQYEEERKKAEALYEEREAASTMYAMNRSFRRPKITLMGTTEKDVEDYTNVLQK